MNKYYIVLCLLTVFFTNAQTKKSVSALRIDESPSIDGILNESFWQLTETAGDFVMFKPGDGGNERENKKTRVKIVYDDEAIYFGITLYDDEPEKIPMQFGGRDEIRNVDFFLLSINPNNDGQNDTEFLVMSTGAQADAKVTSNGEDFSWNAVWYSHVQVNEDGWVIEIKIPYSALRFSNTNVQTWGINFHRKISYINEQYSWNYIDKKTGMFTQYSGDLTGIENITPPTRLSFSPYASSSYTTGADDVENGGFEHSIGLDLKYGINESFTLDATLIPDFGQTAFDDQVLNLGPFEQRYSEKRSFFTEGTELFDKGGLFYSRRIGNTPVNYFEEDELNDGEEIVENPSNVNMLNAVKLSGRTKGGLGIGIFNAITEKTSAKIRNLHTEKTYKVVTEPLANYNVLVLDQQFNKNSSVTLINTNVLRNGHFRDANTTGLLFDISDRGNKYNVSGNLKMSNVLEDGINTTGLAGFLRLSKIHGNYQYAIGHWKSDDKYDIQDLGFQRRNNYSNFFGAVSYRIFEPSKHFNNFRISLEASIRKRNTGEYTGNNFEFDSFFVTTNRFAFGLDMETNLGMQYDYYEPRVEGYYFKQRGVFEVSPWISTDYRKKFAFDIRSSYAFRYGDDSSYRRINISPRYRFSDKFELIYSLSYSKLINEDGYVNDLEDGRIIFGNRNIKTFTNSLVGKLSFNTKSSLSLSFRHYWSPVKYDSHFFELNDQGTLNASTYNDNNDINYNIWNLDLSYSWEFAPGSQLLVLYRNSIFKEDELSGLNFGQNLDNLFKESITNNFSVKFIYYLDYNKIKTWL